MNSSLQLCDLLVELEQLVHLHLLLKVIAPLVKDYFMDLMNICIRIFDFIIGYVLSHQIP